MKRAGTLAGTLVMLALVTDPCRAGDVSLADTLFREGKALMEAGEFARACPKLARSLEEDAATGTLLALALCQERTGALASAWSSYTRAAERSRHEGNLEREKASRARALALVPRLSTLTMIVPSEVSALAGLEVRRNGHIVRPPWSTPVPVDAGEHVIEVSAPNHQTWTTRIVLRAEAEAATVTVPLLARTTVREASPTSSAPAAAASAPHLAPPADASPPPAQDDSGGTLRVLGLVGVGAGVVGVGLGTYFGLRAQSLNDDSQQGGRCNANVCNEDGTRLRNSAGSAADVSTVAFIAGGVLAAGGITLYLVGKGRENATTIGISPASRGGVALLVSGRL